MPDGAIPFALVHVACLAAFWTGVTFEAVIIGIAIYWLRVFAITARYHRYFSHRAFSSSRPFQLVLAVLAQSTAQKSVCGGPPSTATTTCTPTGARRHSPVGKGLFRGPLNDAGAFA